VSVGVSQGLSPPTSKVTVEIEVRPHLTVQGQAGQSGSTGIGLNYNYDY
jgi:autotransporter translocation and assembly factor TamB